MTEPILIILLLRLSRKVRRGFAAEKLALAKEQELLAKIYQLESQVAQTASDIKQEVSRIESPVNTLAGTNSNEVVPPPNVLQSPETGQS